MDPLYLIQVAVKNNVGVLYFSFNLPAQSLFTEDGKMGKRHALHVMVKDNSFITCILIMVYAFHYLYFKDRKTFLATWKELPPSSEVHSTVNVTSANTDAIQNQLETSNVFVIARRSVDVGGTTQVFIMNE